MGLDGWNVGVGAGTLELECWYVGANDKIYLLLLLLLFLKVRVLSFSLALEFGSYKLLQVV